MASWRARRNQQTIRLQRGAAVEARLLVSVPPWFISPPSRPFVQPLELHIVIPVREVKIAPVDLHFAALEVERFAAEGWLGRLKRGAVIAVEYQAVRVLVAEVELADARVGALAQAVA